MQIYTQRIATYYAEVPPSRYDTTKLNTSSYSRQVHGPWMDMAEIKKREQGKTYRAKAVAPITMVKRIKTIFARSGWSVSIEEHDEVRDVASVQGAKVYAGHITRSHATSMWDYFGLQSMLFQPEVAQERAGHTKATFEKSYCRTIPDSILERWKTHSNNIYLSPDEILFI